MKKKLMFDSWNEFKEKTLMTIRSLIVSTVDIIFIVIFGLLSLVRWLWRLIVKAVGNYPAASVIIACALILGVWAITFAQSRSRIVCAEYQRDSLSYELAKLTRNLDRGEYKVIGSDTIHTFNSYDK